MFVLAVDIHGCLRVVCLSLLVHWINCNTSVRAGSCTCVRACICMCVLVASEYEWLTLDHWAPCGCYC